MECTAHKLPRAMVVGVVLAIMSCTLYARDRGFNQPGVAGNTGGPVHGRDSGINQPGAVGNRGLRR